MGTEIRQPDLEAELKERVLQGPGLPRHIAVIMDGNGRWAKRRRRPRIFGHLAGRHAVRQAVMGCRELGVEVLTLYTFSVENWHRPGTEVSALMRILQRTLGEQRDEMKEHGIRLGVLGRAEDLPDTVLGTLRETMDFLRDGKDMLLNLALSYGGRSELTRAARAIAQDAAAGVLKPEDVDEAAVARRLYTAGLPDPDLLIRTSGEFRISNFLLWQAAYSEIWVTDVLWPDFRKEHLFRAVLDYQHRERRFGRVR